ncbi:MAG: hypothetical protein ACOX5G_08260 [Kiritimatiellia bacterium]|jgi:type II secretory pathway component PulK
MNRLSRNEGSVLLIAVVAVATAAALAVAAGFAVRGKARAAAGRARRRDGLRHAEEAAVRALFERVAADTNAFDSLDEPWAREPWEVRDEGWILRVSGDGWRPGVGETTGLRDAESLLPLNTADEKLLQTAGVRLAGLERAAAVAAARSIAAYRIERRAAISNRLERAGEEVAPATNAPPFRAMAELACVEGLPEGAGIALEPWFTAHGSGKLNPNTAPDALLECALVAAGGGDIAAALRLRDRIRSFRAAGGVFTAADAPSVARALGGIPPDETLLLARACEGFEVVSTVYEGVAEALSAADYQAGRPPFRLRFAWDKTAARFLWTIEE